MSKIIAQGAEALLIKRANSVIKQRIKKGYRLLGLDEKLRRQRTKKEARLLEKVLKIILVPKVIRADNYNIELEMIKGKKLSEHLDKLRNAVYVCRQIGTQIAKIHDAGIIHGDLTTSNMILSDKGKKVYFIDFGLGFESDSAEDKAVDLHVLKESLEAKHFVHAKNYWSKILEGYKISKNDKDVMKRLEKVEKRGRYKNSY